MRPQFNIPMDDYPELPEKIRKLCKVRGYRINDFCCRILSEGCDREIARLGGVDAEKPEAVLKSDIDFMFRELEAMFSGLRGRVEDLEELRSRVVGLMGIETSVNRLAEELKLLGNAYNEDIPPIKNSIWLLEQSMLRSSESITEKSLDSLIDSPQDNRIVKPAIAKKENRDRMRCQVCSWEGVPTAGGVMRNGAQLYYCGNPEHKTAKGLKYRSVKFDPIA